jgi:undecaprenyl-diphosphatase
LLLLINTNEYQQNRKFIANDLRSIEIITYTTLVFGVLLGIAVLLDTRRPHAREILAWKDIVFIGVMQTLALVPGVSRSGVTITAGLLIGLSKKATIQFAFLLSIPVITLSVLLILIGIYQQQQMVDLTLLVVGFVVSGISAYLTIIFFIRALNTMSMMPFVVYRLFLGISLLML